MTIKYIFTIGQYISAHLNIKCPNEMLNPIDNTN